MLSAASHHRGLSQLSVEAPSLFGVTLFSGGLVLLIMGFSISIVFGWLRPLGVDFRSWACSVVTGFLANGIGLVAWSWGSHHQWWW